MLLLDIKKQTNKLKNDQRQLDKDQSKANKNYRAQTPKKADPQAAESKGLKTENMVEKKDLNMLRNHMDKHMNQIKNE